MELGEPVSYVHFISSRYLGEPHITVKRDKNVGVRIEFGRDNTIFMDMETLKNLCNDIAEVLDEWFDERDRKGNA